MNLDQLKSVLQRHMQDGMLLVVGSGLSIAEGIPGMGQLADHLIVQIGIRSFGSSAEWQKLVPEIKRIGLEAALLATPPSAQAELLIGELTAEFIEQYERIAINEVFTGVRNLRLSQLLNKLIIPSTGLPVVTTNYDRLIEVAAEEAGKGVDTLFAGRFAAPFDPALSSHGFCTGISLRGGSRTPTLNMRDRVIIYKPHGSLDWYERGGVPVQCPYPITGQQRLIITPGHNKFRNGYASPFDQHRSNANDAIQRAKRFLVIGYGFNDDHLETHLSSAIRSGKPTLVLAKDLSPKVVTWASSTPTITALESATKDGTEGTRVVHNSEDVFFPGMKLWDVHYLVTETLTA